MIYHYLLWANLFLILKVNSLEICSTDTRKDRIGSRDDGEKAAVKWIVCYQIIIIYLAGWIAKLSLKNSHQSGEYIREALWFVVLYDYLKKKKKIHWQFYPKTVRNWNVTEMGDKRRITYDYKDHKKMKMKLLIHSRWPEFFNRISLMTIKIKDETWWSFLGGAKLELTPMLSIGRFGESFFHLIKWLILINEYRDCRNNSIKMDRIDQ